MAIHAKSLFAENYVVTSSVVSMSIAQASGSTIFGNSVDDSHTFTGNITASGNVSGSITSTGSFGDVSINTGNTTNAILHLNSAVPEGATEIRLDHSNSGRGSMYIQSRNSSNKNWLQFGEKTFDDSQWSESRGFLTLMADATGGGGRAGYVGIGPGLKPYFPAFQFHITGSGTMVKFESSNTSVESVWTNSVGTSYIGYYNDGIGFYSGTGSTRHLHINNADGKIGLGTSAPSEAVHISGSGTTKLFVEGDVSGSSTSTGSFGRVETKEFIGHRPMTTHIADFTSSADYAGHYNIVGGQQTCSILPNATTAVDDGTEYEFFQTSSLGNMLFETGSGVSLYVKNNNLNLAGQYSGASLKKVATNTWHLVGDLT